MGANSFKRSRGLGVVKLAVGVTVGLGVIVILATPTRWASSGVLRMPIRVIVNDTKTSKPISGAKVGVFHSLPESPRDHSVGDWLLTDAGGAVEVECEFETGATDQRPEVFAHLDRRWIAVRAEGFYEKIVPVRNEWLPVIEVRALGRIEVPVGLSPGE